MSDPAQLDLQSLSRALAAIVQSVAQSVVSIRSHCARSSGIAWRDDLVVTADEALAEDGGIAVELASGEHRAATLVGRDPSTDVALVRVEGGGLTPLPLQRVTQRPGALALVVGARDGAARAAFGIVSAAGPEWRSMRGGRIDTRLELDVRLPGASEGGAAVDAEGNAVGMAVFGPRRRVLVIPSATIGRVAPTLERHGRMRRGYLGLVLRPVAVDGEPGRGAMVMGVTDGGPGAAAGVCQGDVLVKWRGEPISRLGVVLRSLDSDSVGDKVDIELRRGGEPLQITLTVGERPAH